jgi:hypothetical protein
MNIEVQEHAVVLDMIFYIEQLLSDIPALIKYDTPAVKESFQVTTENQLLNNDAKGKFHTIMAK